VAENPTITAKMSGGQIICRNESGAEVAAGAPAPKAGELFLMSLAGCSGATLKAIMAKEGWNLEALDITVEGIIAADKPRRYGDVNIHYTIACKGLPDEKAAAYVKATGENCFVMQSVACKKHLSFTVKS